MSVAAAGPCSLIHRLSAERVTRELANRMGMWSETNTQTAPRVLPGRKPAASRPSGAVHDPTALASIASRLSARRDSETRTARFVRALAGAAFLVLSIGPSAALAAGPPAAAGSSLGDGVHLVRAGADPHAALLPLGSRGSDRIVGGTATTIQKWPWQVALTLSPSSNAGNALDRQICGGSLVTPRIVLSAAHCFFNGVWSSPSDYAIVSGRTQLSSSQGVEVPVDDYYYLTDKSGKQLYNPNTEEWDVVVVRLSQSVPSEPIKLASADESKLWAGGSKAFATGWGATFTANKSDVLQQAALSIAGDAECRSQWGLSKSQSSLMLCASAPGRDTCSGDSGGPLVVAAGGGRYRLVGDTSYGGVCGAGGVYGRLSGSPMREKLRDAVLKLDGVDIVEGVYGEATASKTQKQKGKKILVKVEVRAREDLDAKASGKATVGKSSYKLKKTSRSLAQGKSATLKLKPAKSKDNEKIAKALKKSKGKAKVDVSLSDGEGNSSKPKLSVTLTG